MAVLKTTSPERSAGAPKLLPSKTVPSSRARIAESNSRFLLSVFTAVAWVISIVSDGVWDLKNRTHQVRQRWLCLIVALFGAVAARGQWIKRRRHKLDNAPEPAGALFSRGCWV